MPRYSRVTLCVATVLTFAFSEQGRAFSVGVRAGAGSELLTMSGIKLIKKDDGQQITADADVERVPIQFGADLVVTPVQFGSLGISAIVGFRGTSANVEGSFSDEREFNYLPIGLSVDYTIGSLRLSGLGLFDLGLAPKFVVSSAETNTKAELEVKNLSRLRFGVVGEFFILKNLSVFGGADFITGSYDSGTGALNVAVQDPNSQDNSRAVIEVAVSEAKNKISGFSFGGGVAFTYSLSSPNDSKPTVSPKKQGKKLKKKVNKKKKTKR